MPTEEAFLEDLLQDIEKVDGRRVNDAVLPLYVSRKVLNAEEVLTWAREQGFENLLDPDELHVTQAYSRQPLEWFDVEQSWEEKLEIGAGGPRAIEMFGSAVVLRFASRSLQWRFEELQKLGASWDYAEYKPHVTLSYAGSIPPGAVPYQGRLELGPEIFEEVDDPTFFADAYDPQPRAPKGSPNGGQWVKGGAGAAGGGAAEYLEKAPSVDTLGSPSERGGFIPMPEQVQVADPDSEVITAMYRQSRDYFKDKGPEDLVEVTPSLGDLVATQPVLKRSTFEELATNYDPSRSTKKIQPGNAYRTPSGKLVLFDGHHRMIAAAFEGRTITTLVYEGDLEI